MFESIRVIGGPLRPSSAADVKAAETQLGVRFPTGYREYVTRFGEGVLGGAYIRIYPPHRILAGPNNVGEWRERIREYWQWEEAGRVLTKQEALEGVIIGDTVAGDELVVHPSNPDRIMVLPHDSETIYVAGNGLQAVIEWLCGSGTLTDPFDERDFEPFNSK